MIIYGSYQIDPAQLPAKNVLAILTRGISHYLGNEVSAKVFGEVRRNAKAMLIETGVEKPSDEQIAAQVDGITDEAYAAIKSRLTDEAFARLMSGEVGAGSVRGPSVTPLEKAIMSEAKARVTARLKANGLKVPKGEETVTIRGVAKTFETLVSECIDREGTEEITIKGVKFESIERVAKRHIAEQEKRNKAAKALADANATDGGEAEGL